jgi:menaquinone-dependent protoporphyrinogen oxidase
MTRKGRLDWRGAKIHHRGMRTLIAYGTTEGHTRTMAMRMAEWIEAEGEQVDLVDTTAIPRDFDAAVYDAYILAGSIHMGKHQAGLIHFVKANLGFLLTRPSAFISVSLSAAGDEHGQGEARKYLDQFLDETGWTPTLSTTAAGALLYTQYDWVKRTLMRAISKREGGDTDTSQDFEYTDWNALREFVRSFVAAALGSVPPAPVG